MLLVGANIEEEPVTHQTITKHIEKTPEIIYNPQDIPPFIEETDLYLSSKDCEKILQATLKQCGLLLIKYEVTKNDTLHTCYALD